MSRFTALLGAAALFVSVSAFAQTAAPPSASPNATVASSDASQSSDDMAKHKHHAHHHDRSAGDKSTDFTADKLNACQAFANPSSSQVSCLQQASHS